MAAQYLEDAADVQLAVSKMSGDCLLVAPAALPVSEGDCECG
jgi:hypothetical protein